LPGEPHDPVALGAPGRGSGDRFGEGSSDLIPAAIRERRQIRDLALA